MAILAGKKGLILGVANEKSIAWGVAQACRREGAELGFSYLGEALERRVRPLAESLDASLIAQLDVSDDAQLDAFFDGVRAQWGGAGFCGALHRLCQQGGAEGAIPPDKTRGFPSCA